MSTAPSSPARTSLQPTPTGTKRRRMFPALPKAAFTQAYESWCTKHSIQLENIISGQPIDVHRLHIEILSAASVEQVRCHLHEVAVYPHPSKLRLRTNGGASQDV